MNELIINEINKKINHYKWLDKHLNDFWIKVFGKNLAESGWAGIISAHGDKGRQYLSFWAKNGICFPHAMALFLLTYTSKMDNEKDNAKDWVVTNYLNYTDLLPEVSLTDNDVIKQSL